jgi:lysophospholipase L1-like esterase
VNITLYGDSILKGVLLEEGKYKMNRSWEQRLAAEHGVVIRNRARFGCTIGKALGLIEKDCAAHWPEGELALLEFGGNDCDFDWAAIAADPEGSYVSKTPPETFRSSYRRAVELVKESGREPVLLTLPPIHPVRYLNFICRDGLKKENILHWLGDVDAIYRWQDRYSEMVEQVAREEKTRLIDLRRAFPRSSRELEPLLCDDGIHPSRLGQKLIFDTLCASLS